VNDNTKRILVIAIPLIAMVASALLLTGVFGPTDDGLRCARTLDKAECQVLRTRFFGLFGNSAFTIPESTVLGAKAFCTHYLLSGGHSAPSCNVYLTLDSGQRYLVSSYRFQAQADASANRLNDYISDKSARSIEIKEDLRLIRLMRILFHVGPGFST
jgi:hypothetical protein